MAQTDITRPRIALVYDQVTTGFGGAEVVLEQLHKLYPEAPLFTTAADTQTAHWANGWNLQTSFLQKLPRFIRRRHQWHALVAPIAVESLDVSNFDIIISVSAGAAKGVLTQPNQLHICYLLTPTRYLYDPETVSGHRVLRLPIIGWVGRKLLGYLRWWDQAAAQRPDHLLAISKLVARRTNEHYSRVVQSVVYPPFRSRIIAEKARLEPQTLDKLGPFDIVISRLVWYKRVDLAVAAALHNQSRLILIGEGAVLGNLITLAGAAGVVRNQNETLAAFLNRAAEKKALILFCGTLSDEQSSELLSRSRSLLMLGVEDFGMTPLEALAFGKPVVIDAESGVAELLEKIPGCILLDQPTTTTVAVALTSLDRLTVSPALLKRTAHWYSDTVFAQTFAKTVASLWHQHRKAYERTA